MWDIYGNRLRRGFCEVHPYVEEEYPCSICMQDIERQNKQQAEYKLAEQQYQQEVDRQYLEHCQENELAIVTDYAKSFKRFLETN